MADGTIRMTPVCIGYRTYRWHVDPNDPANGNADALLASMGYPERLQTSDLGELVLALAGENIRLVFEPLPATR